MLNAIKNIILEYAEVDESQLTEDTNIITDLNLNSYDFISIIGKIEDEFGIEIPERDVPNFETLGDVEQYLRDKISE